MHLHGPFFRSDGLPFVAKKANLAGSEDFSCFCGYGGLARDEDALRAAGTA